MASCSIGDGVEAPRAAASAARGSRCRRGRPATAALSCWREVVDELARVGRGPARPRAAARTSSAAGHRPRPRPRCGPGRARRRRRAASCSGGGPLQVEVGVVLPRVADAAEHLDAVLGAPERRPRWPARPRRPGPRPSPASSPSSNARAASHTAARAASRATSMSAQRCFTAWNCPIGRPNCTRTWAYSAAVVDAPVGDADRHGARPAPRRGGPGPGRLTRSVPMRRGRQSSQRLGRDHHVVEPAPRPARLVASKLGSSRTLDVGTIDHAPRRRRPDGQQEPVGQRAAPHGGGGAATPAVARRVAGTGRVPRRGEATDRRSPADERTGQRRVDSPPVDRGGGDHRRQDRARARRRGRAPRARRPAPPGRSPGRRAPRTRRDRASRARPSSSQNGGSSSAFASSMARAVRRRSRAVDPSLDRRRQLDVIVVQPDPHQCPLPLR